MKLDNHNYEMYFLLYADNELCLEERKMVEDFIIESPEFKNELELLLSTKISVENISLDNKIDLFKFKGESLQENLLLHLDDETYSNKYDLENLIERNEDIKAEWNILKSTKLDKSEELVFKNKALLYRHEKRVVSFRYIRLAIAAVLIGLGIFFGIRITSNKKIYKNIPEFVNTNKKANNNSIQNNNTIQNSNSTIVDPVIEGTEKKDVADLNKQNQDHNNSDLIEIPNGADKKESIINEKSHLVKEEILNNKKKGNSEEVNQNEISNYQLALNENKNKNEADLLPENSIEVNKISSERKVAKLNPPKYESMPAVSMAVAAVSKTTDENLGHVFIIDEEKVNRSKVGGLFKRVKRFVDKTTNIDLPDHLSVGKYEIAIK